MNKEKRALPELLAPAGSDEAFEAAIAAGADAVYFGAERFSARARAKNLSRGEMFSCLKECRARGIKSHGAINIRLKDGELSSALECAWDMLCAGADALIIADIGLASQIRHHFPEAVLHASTQVTGSSAWDAASLAKLGFSRMVCPRELSFPELKELVRNSPIGIEMFIHGAHCVSVSGQCSMSYVMGGRSGNRGDCAGPCRLPFDAGVGAGRGGKASRYALSLKDMCLAGHILEIIDMGVESLKIEGRLKGPEYVYGVVSIYRRLLDERRNANHSEISKLADLFSRDGFTDGYFTSRYGEMLGTRGNLSAGVQKDKTASFVPDRVPVHGKLRLHTGEPTKLTLSSPFGRADAAGEVLYAAAGKPPSKKSLTGSISKLGSTPFVLKSLEIDTDGLCGISTASLNALRRQAADMLCAPPVPVRVEGPFAEYERFTPSGKAARAAVLSSGDQLTEEVYEYFDEIYIPFGDYLSSAEDGSSADLPAKIGVSLPEVFYGGFAKGAAFAVSCAAAEGRKILAHTLGELSLSAEAGAPVVCSHRFVVSNSRTAAELVHMGASSVTLSPEISVKAAVKISEAAPVSVLAGGRMPLMLCRRCPMSDGGHNCRVNRSGGYDGQIKKNVCRGWLRDRTGASFPAIGDRYCMTTVYNSIPTWSGMTNGEAESLGISRLIYIFSIESAGKCGEAVRRLRENTPPDEYRRLR